MDAPIEITANDLLDEAMKDDKASLAKYGKKIIEITGVVDKLPSAGSVQFAGRTDAGISYFVTLVFQADSRVGLSAVKVGDTVTIVGLVNVLRAGKGSEVLLMPNGKTKYIMMTQCKLAK